jgi:hypothetical protein
VTLQPWLSLKRLSLTLKPSPTKIDHFGLKVIATFNLFSLSICQQVLINKLNYFYKQTEPF